MDPQASGLKIIDDHPHEDLLARLLKNEHKSKLIEDLQLEIEKLRSDKKGLLEEVKRLEGRVQGLKKRLDIEIRVDEEDQKIQDRIASAKRSGIIPDVGEMSIEERTFEFQVRPKGFILLKPRAAGHRFVLCSYCGEPSCRFSGPIKE